ncbi:BOLA class I histocompatibility antigen, alpha chain BL3-7-like [Misgurnus anguillicaudatus]|uniref:BOLA class I histocompatibility antigen, alpha chain BL3-7-like n=1 Tax=Misgurnus anguillicaudatus TaxID=75329 RepID=UPI003CCF88BB
MYTNLLLYLFSLLLSTATPKGSHSLWFLSTYIKGQTPFPKLSGVLMLDDLRVLYFNGDTRTFIRRGNTTNEDDVLDPNNVRIIIDNMLSGFRRQESWLTSENLNTTDSAVVFQRLFLCELKDGEPIQTIARNALGGITIDELRYIDKQLTYESTFNVTAEMKFYLDIHMLRYEHFYHPSCITFLKGYLKKRGNQVNRKVKPKVRLFQTDLSPGSWVCCLATGFYPRYINLTMYRDGQPVSDNEITGGDLLPNDDGTYQMRKNLKISEEEQREKHKYTCTATHLSLDNKLDMTLEFDHGTPLKPVLSSVLSVLALVIVTVAAVIIWRKIHSASSKREYSSASTSEELVYTAS